MFVLLGFVNYLVLFSYVNSCLYYYVLLTTWFCLTMFTHVCLMCGYVMLCFYCVVMFFTCVNSRLGVCLVVFKHKGGECYGHKSFF